MTATTVDFEKFCSKLNKGYDRYDATKPFVVSGYRYATNYYVAIRCPSTEPDTTKGEKSFAPITTVSEWKQFPLLQSSTPTIELPAVATKECEDCKVHECPECEGSCEVVWYGDYSGHRYSEECCFCDGTGDIDQEKAKRSRVNQPVASQDKCETCGDTKVVEVDDEVSIVAGVRVANKFLRLIADLPGLRVQPSAKFAQDGEPFALLFEADGDIQGVVMSRSKPV